jgi:hypothetical protein
VGFSIEVWSVLQYLKPDFATLLRDLRAFTPGAVPGPILRFGGNSADASCYVEEGINLPPGCAYRITRDELASYKSFSMRNLDLNVSLVIDVNFGVSSSPALAVAHVKALDAAGLWPFIRGIEIGNEQDHYARRTPVDQYKKGHRNMSYSYEHYSREFSDYLSALRAAGMPMKRVQGGTWSSLRDFVGNLNGYVHRFKNELRSFSYHRYPVSRCQGEVIDPGELLADKSSYSQAERIAPLVAAAAGTEFLIGEGNSVACGGFSGVSDTFLSALWALDFLSEISKVGVTHFNFHIGPRALYTAIAVDNDGGMVVRPLYYGLRLFAEFTANASVWLRSFEVSSNSWVAPMPNADPLCRDGIAEHNFMACCASSCGSCGGVGCEQRPGGESSCCTHAIAASERMCNDLSAPCVRDPTYQRSPVAQHAVRDERGTVRVLVIARSMQETRSAPRMTTVCLPSDSKLGPGARTAELVRLVAPSYAATHVEPITLAGQSWSKSKDGVPHGARVTLPVHGVLGQSGDSECFTFELPPLSAAMLVIPDR